MKFFKKIMEGFETTYEDKQKYLYRHSYNKEGAQEFDEMFDFWVENKEALKKLVVKPGIKVVSISESVPDN